MTDMEESYRSWEKILGEGGKTIFPSHGRPFAAEKLRKHMGQIATEELVKFF